MNQRIKTETEEVKPWENVYISDEDAVNEKLLYYKKLPDQKKVIGKGRLVTLLDLDIPEVVVEDLKYTQYQIGTHYFLNLGSVVNVRATPHFKAPIRIKKYRYQRLSMDAIVEGEYSNKSGSADGTACTGWIKTLNNMVMFLHLLYINENFSLIK